ncbi:microtubule-associated tumor suppressor 1 homolog isoform X1 [Lepisosteus oculatus]|uniref:microtubule-associated tumor suppressor 1 homolog isoform X1 n=1 Tax=Lepisosteus oculatus TaxID=7918 RepID=UPI0035F5215C
MSVNNVGEQRKMEFRLEACNSKRVSLLIGDRNGNKVLCNTESLPDSFRSISSLSSGSTGSPDVEMIECDLSMVPHAEDFADGNVFQSDGFNSTVLKKPGRLCDKVELPDSESAGCSMSSQESMENSPQNHLGMELDTWNDNLALETSGFQEYSSGQNKYNVDVCIRCTGYSLGRRISETDEEWLEDAPETENPGCANEEENISVGTGQSSLDDPSSGELLVRRSSFDASGSDKPSSLSVVEESSSSCSVPADLGRLSSVMPDICGGSLEGRRVVRDGMDVGNCTVEAVKECTGESLSTDNGLPLEKCFSSFPREMEGTEGRVSHASFSPSSCMNLREPRVERMSTNDVRGLNALFGQDCTAQETCGETGVDAADRGSVWASAVEVKGPEQLQSILLPPKGDSAAESKTFLVISSEDSDCNCSVQTSTPQPDSRNVTFCVHSFDNDVSEQPSDIREGDLGSPAHRIVQQRPPSPKEPTRTKPSALVASKNAKAEIKKFPKPDFKNIKPKVVSRPVTLSKTSSSARAKASPRPAVASRGPPSLSPPRDVPQTGQKNSGSGSWKSRNKVVLPSAGPGRPPASASNEMSTRVQKTSSSCVQKMADRDGCANSSSSLTSDPAVGGGTAKHPSKQGSQNKPAASSPKSSPRKERTGCGLLSSVVPEAAQNRISPESPPDDVRERSAVSTSAAPDASRTRLGQKPYPSKPRGAPSSLAPAANLRLPPPASKPKLGASGRDGSAPGNASPSRTKPLSAPGAQKMRVADRTPATRQPMNPGSGSARSAAASKLPVKPQALRRTSSVSSVASSLSEPNTATGNGRAAPPVGCKQEHKPSQSATSAGPHSAARTPLGRPPGGRHRTPLVATRTPAAGSKTSAFQAQNPPRATSTSQTPKSSSSVSSRQVRPTVDRARQKSPRDRPAQAAGPPDPLPAESRALGVAHYRTQCERSGERAERLRALLAASDSRFEAVALVVQHVLAQREEALKQRKELSQELVNLRSELVGTASSCERLERERDELRGAYEALLQRLQEQHRAELAELEERLRGFYAAEWEKVHEAYQREADKIKAQMQQQVDELGSKHESLRKELETRHSEKIELLKQHYETSIEDLKISQDLEKQSLNKSFQDTESSLCEQIHELTAANDSLNEKLKAEEERRRALMDKNQRDSHTLYLEQELESLKVVLDIKTEQLHQQDKKLIQMEKLMERNIKLEEGLNRVQQENEDLKARMDKHAALSRQLSTEQAVLQESLEKESKVNKRLSMENEELLWKLHNGDLSSPRRLSPSSPSGVFQSPRNSGAFSSPPVSPR